MKTIVPRFSTRRMVKEYVEKFYAPAVSSQGAPAASTELNHAA
jgi:glucan phosphorylase